MDVVQDGEDRLRLQAVPIDRTIVERAVERTGVEVEPHDPTLYHVYRFTVFIPACGYLNPAVAPAGITALISSQSSRVIRTFSAPRFSSSRSTFRTPGIVTICGDCCSTHASASCAV